MRTENYYERMILITKVIYFSAMLAMYTFIIIVLCGKGPAFFGAIEKLLGG